MNMSDKKLQMAVGMGEIKDTTVTPGALSFFLCFSSIALILLSRQFTDVVCDCSHWHGPTSANGAGPTTKKLGPQMFTDGKNVSLKAFLLHYNATKLKILNLRCALYRKREENVVKYVSEKEHWQKEFYCEDLRIHLVL